MQTAASKISGVRSYFEEPQRYLTARGFDVQIRVDSVQELTAGLAPEMVLDIGCGDGSISLPFLNSKTSVTFLDLSTGMTALTRSKVPEHLLDNATFLNDDFMAAELPAAAYDLIICLGVLAHVDAPEAFVAKLNSLLRPGGRLILEFTDSKHPVGRTVRLYQWLCALRKPRSYKLNSFSARRVMKITKEQHLRLLSTFRYSLFSFGVFSRIVSPETLARLIRRCFGTPHSNRTAWLGEEYICVLQKDIA